MPHKMDLVLGNCCLVVPMGTRPSVTELNLRKKKDFIKKLKMSAQEGSVFIQSADFYWILGSSFTIRQPAMLTYIHCTKPGCLCV